MEELFIKGYAVVSCYGSYDDAYTKVIKIFKDKEKAEQLVEDLKNQHLEKEKFPLVYEQDKFESDLSDSEYRVEVDHKDFVEQSNPNEYGTDDYNKWDTEFNEKYWSLVYTYIKNEYKDLTFEDFKKVIEWIDYKYSSFNEYTHSYIEEVDIDLS